MPDTAMTFYFEDIWPDWDSFRAFLDEIPIPLPDPIDVNFAKQLYKNLYRRYNHSNVRYTVPDAFMNEFSIIFEDRYAQYKAERAVIDKLHALTDEELIEVGSNITNTSLNPNDSPTDPKQPLNFVSGQVAGWQKTGKLQAYLSALAGMPSARIQTFVDSFKDLFMAVLPNTINLYGGE